MSTPACSSATRRRRRHHLDAVYEEAVRAATALAAANGLVTEDVTSEEA